MRRLITICAAIVLVSSIGTTVEASIRDNVNYVASSNLVLAGPLDATKGWPLAQEFQLNLEYQAGIDDANIDAFNAYNPYGNLNFPDYDYYYLKVDANGGLPIGIWDFENGIQDYAPDSGESWVKWTLSYWDDDTYYHTILAGDIIEDPYLHVCPTAGYRSFLWDGLANDVEIFNGATVNSEVLGYVFPGDIGALGEGSVLEPKLVPEPATICLVGLGALGMVRRKRS